MSTLWEGKEVDIASSVDALQMIAPHHFGVRELFAAMSYRNRRAQNYFCNTFGRNGIRTFEL